jgi:hypothetical protein
MSRDKDRLPHYLEHVLEAIRRIERCTVDMSEQEQKSPNVASRPPASGRKAGSPPSWSLST